MRDHTGTGASRSARRLAAAIAAVVCFAPVTAFGAADPEMARQWNLGKIGAPDAWASSTGAGVLVGIVDSGIDLGHEEFAGRIAGATSCIGAEHDPSKCSADRNAAQDDFGHGTHVAGIIAASKDNGVGIAGVAPQSRLLVAKAIDAQAAGSIGDIDASIHWLVDHGAKVVNISLSEANPVLTSLLGSELRPSVEYAWSKGAVPVVAGGNANLLGLIGSYNFGSMNALIVGATDSDDHVAAYSSPPGSAKWALLAPGGAHSGDESRDIFSTYWVSGRQNQYAYMAGTSMAAPHVSGTVALLLARGFSPQQAVDRILATVDPVSCGGGSPSCKGRLNTARALSGTGSSPTPPPPGGTTSGTSGGSQGAASQAPAAPAQQAAAPRTSPSPRKTTRPTPTAGSPAPAAPAPGEATTTIATTEFTPAPQATPSPEAPAVTPPGRAAALSSRAGGRSFPMAGLLAVAAVQLALVAAAFRLRRRRARAPSGG